MSGTKTWISRLTEAAVFCVFFTGPGRAAHGGRHRRASPGLARRPITPAGLSGWAWGELRLHEVTVRPCDILGQPGQGMQLLREHFAHYRPLVAATALGAAAAVHDQTSAGLDGRRQAGAIAEPARQRPDHPRPDLRPDQRRAAGRAHRPSPRGRRGSPRAAVGVRSQGPRRRCRLPGRLRTRAAGRRRQASPLTRGPRRPARDLNALLYADGIHDSLYRSAGRSLTTPTCPSSSVATSPPFVNSGENDLVHA